MSRNSVYIDIKLQVTMNERILIEQAFGTHRGLSRRVAEAVVQLSSEMIAENRAITCGPPSLDDVLKRR